MFVEKSESVDKKLNVDQKFPVVEGDIVRNLSGCFNRKERNIKGISD
jgi:hypothetical protein